MKAFDRILPLVVAGLVALAALPASAAEPPGVVYHVDSSERAVMAIRNITNHR